MATIAIVDDHVTNCRFMERLLEQAGHVPVSFHTGGGAVEALAGIGADLVILDIRLPDISGVEVLQMLRENPWLSALPVVVISGVSDPEVQARVRGYGVADYIEKGCDVSALVKRIEQHLPRGGTALAG
jgi:DNA-binding response OmpR family regulator